MGIVVLVFSQMLNDDVDQWLPLRVGGAFEKTPRLFCLTAICSYLKH